MPTFCRHNRLVTNCPICAREQDVELRPVVTPGGQPAPAARPGRPASSSSGPTGGSTRAGARGRAGRSSRASGLTVRRLHREADDGYHSPLVPGLRSGAGADRLAVELAFATARLERLATDPPGLYAEVADPAHDSEERTWLAFLIAYLGPLDGEEPFAGIQAARTTWASGELPDLSEAALGPRTSHDASRGARTLDAYRAWAQRAGSQAAAFAGEPSWTAERRFARVFERMALPGLERGARFDLLVTLGRLGVYELDAGALAFGNSDPVTLGAKRILGIGDPLLLERRASDLAAACGVPLAAIDVGFYNWERGSGAQLGLEPGAQPAPDVLEAARTALGLDPDTTSL